MTIFDLSWKEILAILLVSVFLLLIIPQNHEKPKDTRIKKTVRILDKKWDKWLERNKELSK